LTSAAIVVALLEWGTLPINSDMLVVRALKMGQMIRQRPDGTPPTYDSMH